MSSYSNLDQANGAPSYMVVGHSNATGVSLYGNVTPNAFVAGVNMGVFGVDSTEAKVASTGGKGRVAPGWVLATFGHGPITSLTINNGGAAITAETGTVTGNLTSTTLTGTSTTFSTDIRPGYLIYLTANSALVGTVSTVASNTSLTLAANAAYAFTANAISYAGPYSNTDVINFTGGTVNAVATIVTSNTGSIVSYAFANTTAKGRFVNAAGVTLTFANSTAGSSSGNGANVSITLGGHAGRVKFETLACVAMASENTADNTTFANT